MYELRLSKRQKEKFVDVVRYRLIHQDMNFKDLAEKVNRPVNTIYDFMNHNDRSNRFLAAEIAEVLHMTQKDWN